MAKILYVDDSETDGLLFTKAMKDAGWPGEVRWVEAGTEALALMEDPAHRPDLVVTDLHMPNMDGFGLAEHLRADDRLAAIPLFIYTSSIWGNDRRKAYQMGCCGYLLKPASLAEAARHAEFFKLFLDVAGIDSLNP